MSVKQLLTKQQQRERLLKELSEYDRLINRGVPGVGNGREVLAHGLNSLEPRVAYSPTYYVASQ